MNESLNNEFNQLVGYVQFIQWLIHFSQEFKMYSGIKEVIVCHKSFIWQIY